MQPVRTDLTWFLSNEANIAELRTARIRVAILVLVQLRLLFAQGDEMLAGVLKHWFASGCIVLGIAASFLLVPAVHRAGEHKDRLLLLSTTLDAALAFLIMLPGVLWPREAYLGLLASPDFGAWPIIATGAGLRLSTSAARVGPLVAMACVAGLVGLDLQLNRPLLGYGAPEIALALVLMIGAALLARGIEGRIRRLVVDGAGRAVQAERTLQRFGTYVPVELVQTILAHHESAPGQGRVQQVAILFSDLRGFTRYGEQVEPTALFGELNAYLDAMVAVVREQHGIVDKYLGDGMLVVFGVPERRGDEATRALATALGMARALADHNRDRQARGLPPLSQGIGVHFGAVVTGNVGTHDRLQYTVLGDAVNVASRLQDATRELGVDILLSAALVGHARTEGAALPPVEELPPLALRGREEPVGVVTLVAD